jgi:threonylcarbamoyladenosine tRNA methylthiotransferase CDKAL1
MRVYFESYGCTQNLGEAHALEHGAALAGHSVVRNPAEADAAVLVTCGVIGATESRMLRRWRALSERLPHVFVTGCLVPLRTDLLTGVGRARTTFLPIREQSRLPELLARLPLASPHPLETRPAGPPSSPDEPAVTAEVILAQGCTSHCSYCFSRLARGRLRSSTMAEVLSGVSSAVGRGAREVRLSSLDTSCWGMDLPGAPRLPELLRTVAALPGEFTVRVGMMSPQSLRDIAEPYLEALSAGRFFRFLHLPVQSGADSVLLDMRREYTVEEFRRLVGLARRILPDLMLSTDVIVGYPTETEADFESTLRLIDELAPELVNVTRFSPRPGTPAARERPLNSRAVKLRSRRLTELRMRTARRRLERWIGRELPARILERGAHGSAVARLPNYLPVVLPSGGRLGETVSVRVDGARSNYLFGHVAGSSERDFHV